MNYIELIVLAIGLSMDAFAVAVCAGLNMRNKFNIDKAFIVGVYFGVFQAGMPLIGYYTANFFAEKIAAFDNFENWAHWIAFVLLGFIGGKMIADSLENNNNKDKITSKAFSLRPAKMLPLAVATSIDALAVGVSFASLRVDIIPAVLIIGIITFVISMLGVKTGSIFGVKFKSKAQLAGGAILVLIGLKILAEHLLISKS